MQDDSAAAVHDTGSQTAWNSVTNNAAVDHDMESSSDLLCDFTVTHASSATEPQALHEMSNDQLNAEMEALMTGRSVASVGNDLSPGEDGECDQVDTTSMAATVEYISDSDDDCAIELESNWYSYYARP